MYVFFVLVVTVPEGRTEIPEGRPESGMDKSAGCHSLTASLEFSEVRLTASV